MKDEIVVFWFRRDLRLQDNAALSEALQSGRKVLPIYIFDENVPPFSSENNVKTLFVNAQLQKISLELENLGAALSIAEGNAVDVFKEILKYYNVYAVYANREYEPNLIKRDQEISGFLTTHKILFKTLKDQVLFERDEIVKADGLPYKIYTPYSKKWLEGLHNMDLPFFECTLNSARLVHNKFYFSSAESKIAFATKLNQWPYDLSKKTIDNYTDTRNFPGIDGTSKLSNHLRYGTVSVRSCIREAMKSSDITFLKELIWRDFFTQVLWHFPFSVTQNFKEKYNGITWRNNQNEFGKWCKGETGYPMVDAGMRELNSTGFMHNRVRMITASFLCKHLLIDWKWGEAYFAEKLLDYDMALNVGNWQWVAGTGCDSAPYFRVFNPSEQLKKFDKDFTYVKKWVPEFQEFSYKPMVEHTQARKRCLETFKQGLLNYT
jgi:deoxyribodipyrimidine photo-lyase